MSDATDRPTSATQPVAPAGSAEPLRVWHFILDHRVGGPHVYVATLLEAMSGSVQASLLTSGRGPMTDMPLLNLRRYWKPLYGLEVALNALWILARLLTLPAASRPALFHVHGAANIAPLLAARLSGMPLVWHFHETAALHGALARVGARLVAAAPHALLTVAPLDGSGFPGDGGALVPGLVDVGFWHCTSSALRPVAHDVTEDNAGLRLLAVANLNPMKGIDVLLEALANLKGTVLLRVVGAELDTQKAYAATLQVLARRAREANPHCRIEFLGWQPRNAVHALLEDSDAFVLPSRSEACPIALLEAMAMQRVCVATDVGAVRRMLPPSQQVLVVPPENPAALRDALAMVQGAPPAHRQALGLDNLQAVREHHTPARIAALVGAAYAAVLRSA